MADSPVINRANFIVVLNSLVGLGSLGAMYLQRSRQFARRTTCQDHLRKVAEGLQNYEQAHGHYLGERMAPNFGYRIPLLPFIGEQKLHDQILESLADVKEFHDFLLTPSLAQPFFDVLRKFHGRVILSHPTTPAISSFRLAKVCQKNQPMVLR